MGCILNVLCKTEEYGFDAIDLTNEKEIHERSDCSARINPAGSQIGSAPNEVIGAVIRSVYGGCHFKTGMTVLKRIALAKGSQLTLQSISNSLRCF